MTASTSNPHVRSARVLFVGGGMRIGNSTATGQTLACQYEAYPSDHITQYARPELPGGEFGQIVPMSRWLSPLAYSWRIIKVLSARVAKRTRRAPSTAGKVTHNAIRPEHLSLRKRITLDLDAAVDLRRVRIRRRTLKALRDAAPQVIHAVVFNGFSVRLALELSDRLGIPVVPQFTDDWASTIFTNGELRGRARTRMALHLARLIEKSPILLVIGDAMADEYRARYGRECAVTAFGVEPSAYRVPPMELDGKKRLLYVGGGYIGRAEQIDRIGEWVRDEGWEVVVHTTAENVWTPQSSNVTIAGELSLEDLPRALVSADALLFVESFRPEIVEYTRFSVSTKVPQLIAAGRPIVALGPKGQGSIDELVSNAGLAHFVHSDTSADQADVVRFLNHNVGTTDSPIPEKYHASTMRRNFEDALAFAAGVRESGGVLPQEDSAGSGARR